MTVDDSTQPSITMPEEPESKAGTHVLRIVGALFGLVFLSGVVAGFLEAGTDAHKPLSVGGWVFLACVGGLALWVLSWLVRSALAIRSGVNAMPRRERRSTWIVIGITLFGAACGFAYARIEDAAPNALMTADGHYNALFAIISALLYGIIAPILTWWWLKQTDEHEREAYAAGGNVAAHVMVIGMPVWWVLGDAGLVPKPDIITCVVIAAFVWTFVWFKRKYY